ncbi:AAA family ATPase [Flavobacterium sp. AG291]|uniref:AAA family ATPase n=1 Tax=Flavobacterium sp. AG291 TaxID=2184000 RepID=UPI000E09E719|nr:AAA family ATPase [Flavobacterium sp. AG291]RDI06683.1 AAA ATPase-like protein [Flavobacterium sp. AG291]
MKIDKVKINGFKNLNNFIIDLDETKMHTILLGINAAGKSNFLEALVIIFRDLDLNEKKTITPEFNFDIHYKCKNNNIRVIGIKNNSLKEGAPEFIKADKVGFTFFVNDIKLTKSDFYKLKDEHLPKYVFSYYSGISNRLEKHFDTHQRRFLKDLMDGLDDPMRPLFYTRLIHSHFVLLAFYGFPEEKINVFLKEYLNILGLESILFVFKNPYWYKGKQREGGDSKFWYAKGVVKDFLNDLWDASLAPIPITEKVREDFHKNPEEEHIYLYISNQEKLANLAKKYGNNADFFKMLESTYISDLIHEVKVKVRKLNVDGHITFKELSEGEQQLLTVLGLMRFTKDEDTLFLLDEPDTHLNPLWKWKYMSLMEEVVDKDKSSQVIMTTHDPLVIGGLTKEEIRIFYPEGDKKTIKAIEPSFDPKGLGVAGILTSEFFNLPSSLDYDTEQEVIKQYELLAKKNHEGLSVEEETLLLNLNQYLDEIGLNQKSIDPLYDKFLEALIKEKDFKPRPNNPEEIKKQEELVLKVLKEISSSK